MTDQQVYDFYRDLRQLILKHGVYELTTGPTGYDCDGYDYTGMQVRINYKEKLYDNAPTAAV